jgi:hypothetical protein
MNGHTFLVCEKRGGGGKERVAQLVRDDEVDREMGIKKTEAARGGRLDFVGVEGAGNISCYELFSYVGGYQEERSVMLKHVSAT